MARAETGDVRATHTQGSVAGAGVRARPTGHDDGAAHVPARSGDPLALDIANLSLPLRLQLALIARMSDGPAEALPLAIEAIVGGDRAKRDALVAAFTDHPRLAEQWRRAYQTLLRIDD